MGSRSGPAARGRRPHALGSAPRIVASVLALVASVVPSHAAAAGNALSNGSVAPGAGTTATIFMFSVSYTSPRGFGATRVVTLVANQSIEMGLVSGTPDDGVYQASTQIPAGTWPVTFQATAAQGKNPTLAGPTVVVSEVVAAPPPATQAPPPAAPAPAQPGPAPVPPPPAPGGQVEEVPSVDPVASNEAAAPASPSPSAASPAGVIVGVPGGEVMPATASEGSFAWSLIVVATATLVMVAAGWHILAAARRRASLAAAAPVAGVSSPGQVRSPAARQRPQAEWELYGLDDEPIGTVDYIGRPP